MFAVADTIFDSVLEFRTCEKFGFPNIGHPDIPPIFACTNILVEYSHKSWRVFDIRWHWHCTSHFGAPFFRRAGSVGSAMNLSAVTNSVMHMV